MERVFRGLVRGTAAFVLGSCASLVLVLIVFIIRGRDDDIYVDAEDALVFGAWFGYAASEIAAALRKQFSK